jgi:hypothetical protein
VVIGVLVRICLSLAALKVVAAVVVLVAGVRPDDALRSPISDAVFLLNIVVFGTVGILLIYASRSDRRATYLGVAFCLIASSFSDPLVRRLPELLPSLFTPGMNPLSSLQPDAFLPYFFWLFFYEFPRGFLSPSMARFFRLVFRLSLVAGAVLFITNAAAILWPAASGAQGIINPLRFFERKASRRRAPFAARTARFAP